MESEDIMTYGPEAPMGAKLIWSALSAVLGAVLLGVSLVAPINEALADGACGDVGSSCPAAPCEAFYPLEHCLVLLGSEDGSVSVMDPMVGLTSYDRESFARIYGLCGSMAVILAW